MTDADDSNFDIRELGNYFVTSMNSLTETINNEISIGDHVSLQIDGVEVKLEVINIFTDYFSGAVNSSNSKYKANKILSFKEKHIFNLEKMSISK